MIIKINSDFIKDFFLNKFNILTNLFLFIFFIVLKNGLLINK